MVSSDDGKVPSPQWEFVTITGQDKARWAMSNLMKEGYSIVSVQVLDAKAPAESKYHVVARLDLREYNSAHTCHVSGYYVSDCACASRQHQDAGKAYTACHTCWQSVEWKLNQKDLE